MRPSLLLAALVTALCGAACFNIGDRPPPPSRGGSIAGTIQVSGVSGQLAVDPDAVRQARVDVCEADSPPREDAAPMPDIAGRGAPPSPTRPSSKMPLQWKAGDVLVLFDHGAYDRASLAPALDAMIGRAALGGVSAKVARCTAGRYCLARLYKSGALLDESATDAAQKALDKNRGPHVKVVAKNLKKWGFFVPNDPLFNFQWHYDFIHLQAAWDIERGDDSVVVAVVDSGAVTAQPDLSGRWARDGQGRVVGTDMVDPEVDVDGVPGRDTDPEDPGDNLFGTNSSSWHGTHIAGTIGAETDNGEGVAGITMAGRIVPVRVLGNQLSGFDADIMDGIFWAIGQHVDGTPDYPLTDTAKLINLSLGGPTDDASQTFWNDNITAVLSDPSKPIIVAAAGNSDEDAGGIVPANVPGMITVGAVNIRGLRASYSNFGASVDVMAPGGDEGTDENGDGQPDGVLSTVNPDYDWRDGTSMACPHVTGVAALLVAANPSLGQTDIAQILHASSNHAGQCNEGCGGGWLDAVSALLLAGGEVQALPLLATDVTQAFFPTGLQAVQVNVLNLGNAPFSFAAAVEGAQAEHFSVSPATGTVAEATSSNPRVALTVTLDRGDLEAGSANLKITTTDADITPAEEASVDLNFNDDPNRNPRQIQEVQVAAFEKKADGTLKSVAKTVARREDQFAYTITGLREGDYEVFAVGDDNQDGQFEADVESFGAYPTRDAPQEVHVGADARVESIDFGIDAAFITDIVGGVGAPCNADNDCSTPTGAQCITTFAGGYCSRLCDDGQCGNNASCEQLRCSDGSGNSVDCNVCLVRCASDSQCRFDEGYICDAGECVPAELPP